MTEITEEKEIWSGTPSQIVNLSTFIICGLFFWLIIPLFIILWQWLVVKNTQYELTTHRLKIRQGVINKKMDDLELYRVRDYSLEQPLLLRWFGLENIILQTSDRTDPVVIIRAVKNGEELQGKIREAVEACRAKTQGVREVDVEQ
ncbi:hypothetical conserved protein [Candidatus Nitrosoglobus terrae]|uniref:Hypothetical conserved protein n=1 Tax=Candidatus Nitrosoglobus terrae TaxID=1630141 RepID=A0A1Q2SL23_9GAMM|nr:PH domain-containing protein [Candidatus Nitrosoglobus terrae]BAW79807.1 hypothetical conserved protein [Candidatus Nitrosoglobus terrae]